MKQGERTGCGFRNRDKYRRRVRLHCTGKPPIVNEEPDGARPRSKSHTCSLGRICKPRNQNVVLSGIGCTIRDR
jgi:hypothetical protein